MGRGGRRVGSWRVVLVRARRSRRASEATMSYRDANPG